MRRRPRLLSRRCGLHAAPRISSEIPPGAQASPPTFKEVRSPCRTTDLLGNTTGYAGISPAVITGYAGVPACFQGGAVSMPHHGSPRKHHRLRRHLARERFGTNRQHPATKKERVIYAPEIVIYCRPFTLVLLSVFSQCLPPSSQYLTHPLFPPIYYLPATKQRPNSPHANHLQQA